MNTPLFSYTLQMLEGAGQEGYFWDTYLWTMSNKSGSGFGSGSGTGSGSGEGRDKGKSLGNKKLVELDVGNSH
ncbi:hypothetical protein, partial [Salmonella enterica]|uniref:hypothetical protein n=1 Tax=Salmonella enterica TaxID=28901 RepID=UPI0020C33711